VVEEEQEKFALPINKNKKTMKKLPLIITAFTLIVGISACKKDRIENKEKNEYAPISDYLDSKKQEEQEFEITGPSNDTITGNQGTKLQVGKDCLMFPNGDSVAYPFTVKLVELYTPKDMIYWQISSTDGINILETEGKIRVRAVKNGQDLVLKDYCYYGTIMPNAAPQSNMRKFYGFDNVSGISFSDNTTALQITTAVGPTFTTDAYGYVGLIPRLGWVNCGLSAGSNSNSTISFTSETDNLQNVGIFIYFPNTKSVMQVYNMMSGPIPNGSNVKILLMAMKSSGEFYHYYTQTTINGSGALDVELTQISEGNLTNILNSL